MHSEAVMLQRRVLSGFRLVHGNNHAFTLESEVILASMLVEQNKIDEAREIYDRLSPIVRRILGPRHRVTGWLNEPDFLDPSRYR